MLNHLSIRNFAIIQAVEISFNKSLTVITGETGAGKSILLGALSLILGERVDRSVLFDQEKKCIIEGVFSIRNRKLKSFFKEHDLDYDIQTTIRREIATSGKSRAFINDTPVNLSVLKQLSSQLIDLHSQHENLELVESQFQFKVVDNMAKHNDLINKYQTEYHLQNILSTQIEDLKTELIKQQRDQDYNQFQYQELEDANILMGEQNQLEEKLKYGLHAEKIAETITNLKQLISSDAGAESLIRDMVSEINAIKDVHENYQALHDRIKSVWIEIDDLRAEIEIMQPEMNDGENLEELERRLNVINRLQIKHHVQNADELIILKSQLQDLLSNTTELETQITELEKEQARKNDQLIEIANRITTGRKKVIPEIIKEVNTLLKKIGMVNGQLDISIEPKKELDRLGIDQLEFLFSANKGSALQPVQKVASGGEVSRLMLAIKSLLASSVSLPTLIFDEIDTGISGETATQVANVLYRLSRNHQVITITHLPQIAAKGNDHYLIYKDDVDGKTQTHVKNIADEERVVHLAKMLSGKQPSNAAMENARELLMN